MDINNRFAFQRQQLQQLQQLQQQKDLEEDNEVKETKPASTMEESGIPQRVLDCTSDLIIAGYNKVFLNEIIDLTSNPGSPSGETRGADSLDGTNSETFTPASQGDFDFSVIPGYNDDFSTFYTDLPLGGNRNATSYNTVDRGYWDKALDALDQLRPQLHEYIKAKLEAMGLEYNHDTVDKFIDYFITQSVEMALCQAGYPTQLDPMDVSDWDKCGVPTNNTTFKMSTVVEALLSMIDGELGIDSKHYAFGTKTKSHDAPDAFSEASWNKTNDLNYNKVRGTADRFLNSDEKNLKSLFVGLEIPDEFYYGATTTSTKYSVQRMLELYQDTVRGYLKQNYTDLTDEQIDAIIEKAMQDIMKEVDSMKFTQGRNSGKYNLEQIVQNFGAKALEILATDYPEQAINHHEGLLFGIEGSEREQEILNQVMIQFIKQRIPGVHDSVVDEILLVIASFGDKVQMSDMEAIINSIIDTFNTESYSSSSVANNLYSVLEEKSVFDREIKKLVEKYLDGKEHHAGLLFGISGPMASAQARAMAIDKIQEKIPDASDEFVNLILSELAKFGDKIKFEDMDGILDRIIAANAQDGNVNIEELIEEYLNNKPPKEYYVNQEKSETNELQIEEQMNNAANIFA